MYMAKPNLLHFYYIFVLLDAKYLMYQHEMDTDCLYILHSRIWVLNLYHSPNDTDDRGKNC